MTTNNRDRLNCVGQPVTLSEAIELMRPHVASSVPVYLKAMRASSADRGEHTKFHVDVRRNTAQAKALIPDAKRITVYGLRMSAQIERIQKSFPAAEIRQRDTE